MLTGNWVISNILGKVTQLVNLVLKKHRIESKCHRRRVLNERLQLSGGKSRRGMKLQYFILQQPKCDFLNHMRKMAPFLLQNNKPSRSICTCIASFLKFARIAPEQRISLSSNRKNEMAKAEVGHAGHCAPPQVDSRWLEGEDSRRHVRRTRVRKRCKFRLADENNCSASIGLRRERPGMVRDRA